MFYPVQLYSIQIKFKIHVLTPNCISMVSRDRDFINQFCLIWLSTFYDEQLGWLTSNKCIIIITSTPFASTPLLPSARCHAMAIWNDARQQNANKNQHVPGTQTKRAVNYDPHELLTLVLITFHSRSRRKHNNFVAVATIWMLCVWVARRVMLSSHCATPKQNPKLVRTQNTWGVL